MFVTGIGGYRTHLYVRSSIDFLCLRDDHFGKFYILDRVSEKGLLLFPIDGFEQIFEGDTSVQARQRRSLNI